MIGNWRSRITPPSNGSTVPVAPLYLIPESLLMPMRPHPFAALVLGNFRFPSFLERAHSNFEILIRIQPLKLRRCNRNG